MKKERVLVKSLLLWYDAHGRDLPWRYKHGTTPDPYRVWLSEVMLQQTTVPAVKPYFESFLERWPDVQALANAKDDDVMRAWAGLGYYARARNLLACARVVCAEHSGTFPQTRESLKQLPGIGDYTAAAMAAIIHGEKVVPLDGNLERVIARVYEVVTPLPQAKTELRSLGMDLFSHCKTRPGDLAQAMMDLGAMVCTPRRPKCGICPIAKECQAYASGLAEELPVRGKQKAKPLRYGRAYWIENIRGEILLHRRPEKGLLGGMTGLPSTDWDKKGTAFSAFPDLEDYQLRAYVRHSFTHFDLHLDLARAAAPRGWRIREPGFFWVARTDVMEHALPNVFRKAVRIFLSHSEAQDTIKKRRRAA
ncbi:MAG: A/G-specific adenine glycosylase [Alphaproteobacteria bacterium]|nr:A/G-specific adenine glycosylase [Alphaproteobacteria bacterium]